MAKNTGHPLNATMIQFFHWYLPDDGQLWNQLAEKAETLKRDGYDAVWLPPAYKGAKGSASEGYDCYDHFDLGEFDQKHTVRTKYGTRDEYLAAIKKAQAAGLDVISDVVMNHKAGADEKEHFWVKKVNPGNRHEAVSDSYEIEGFTRFTFPGRQGQYSSFVWWWPCFTGVDYDHRTGEEAIFTIQSEYGAGWADLVSPEHGNFDYLIFADIEYRNPAVREEMKYWGQWYLQTTGADGVRLDAMKHITLEFVNEWLDHVRAHAGREVFAVGEYWAHEPGALLRYVEATGGRMTLFDAPLHYAFNEASQRGKQYDLRTIFDNSLVKRAPALAVTFVDNHDTVPHQSLESYVEPWFRPLAYALILLREDGYPCVFYPDLYGAEYLDAHKGSGAPVKIEPVYHLRQLALARKQYAWGEQVDTFAEPNAIGWVRRGLDDKSGSGCAVTMSNGAGGRLPLELGPRHAHATFLDLLRNCDDQVQLDEHGRASFPVPAGAVSVWVDAATLVSG